MIPIAAAAIGIMGIQAIVSSSRISPWVNYGTCSNSLILASPMVGMWCLTLLILSFLEPQRGRRRLFQMPGVTAACAVWIGFFGNYLHRLWFNPGDLLRPSPSFVHVIWFYAVSEAGMAILAVWITQALAGWWRPAPVWLDRAGRLLGLFWICAYVIRSLNI